MSESIATELDKIIESMQYLVEHPRIQQKTWVASARNWLPILRIARSSLGGSANNTSFPDPHIEAYQALLDVLTRLGLSFRKRDALTWGYSWHNEPLKGSYLSLAQTVEAGLKERLS